MTNPEARSGRSPRARSRPPSSRTEKFARADGSSWCRTCADDRKRRQGLRRSRCAAPVGPAAASTRSVAIRHERRSRAEPLRRPCRPRSGSSPGDRAERRTTGSTRTRTSPSPRAASGNPSSASRSEAAPPASSAGDSTSVCWCLASVSARRRSVWRLSERLKTRNASGHGGDREQRAEQDELRADAPHEIARRPRRTRTRPASHPRPRTAGCRNRSTADFPASMRIRLADSWARSCHATTRYSPGGMPVDHEAAVAVGGREERVVENHDDAAHVRVDVTEDLDDPGLGEPSGLRAVGGKRPRSNDGRPSTARRRCGTACRDSGTRPCVPFHDRQHVGLEGEPLLLHAERAAAGGRATSPLRERARDRPRRFRARRSIVGVSAPRPDAIARPRRG